MKQQTIAICAGLLGLGLAAPQPATAQIVYPGYRAYPVHPGYAVMPPYEVMSIVRSSGLRPLGRPLRHGPIYVVVALDPSGQEMQVMVDARSGRIMRVGPTLAPRYAAPAPYGRPPRGMPMLPDDYDPRVAELPPTADGPPGPGAQGGHGPGTRPGAQGGYGPGPRPGAQPGAGPGAAYDGPPPAPAGRAPAAQAGAPSAQAGPPPLPRPRPKVASADSSTASPAPAKPATAAAPQAAPPATTSTESKDSGTTGSVTAPAGAAPPPMEMHE